MNWSVMPVVIKEKNSTRDDKGGVNVGLTSYKTVDIISCYSFWLERKPNNICVCAAAHA